MGLLGKRGVIIQGKNIKIHLNNKINDWIASIDDDSIKDLIKQNCLITGGAIVSLLQGEAPHDYDVYFRNEESLKQVCEYYVRKYIESTGKPANEYSPKVQRCEWNEGREVWRVLRTDELCESPRLRIFIKSRGAAGEDYDTQKNSDFNREVAKLNEAIKEKRKESKEKIKPYFPIFMTNNAITLSDGVQIVLRFYGEPADIHNNYDFVHCTSYWTGWDNDLVMPARALESIINKELYYIGSKYPLCSIIRTRKFINRGWNINAGQYVKMVLQLNDLNLKNLHVFEEQLIGVDSAYFGYLIFCIEKAKQNDENFVMDTGYLIDLINEVFDKNEMPDDE